MKFIPETCRAPKFDIYVFILSNDIT